VAAACELKSQYGHFERQYGICTYSENATDKPLARYRLARFAGAIARDDRAPSNWEPGEAILWWRRFPFSIAPRSRAYAEWEEKMSGLAIKFSASDS
jgi:hypothetical protein